MRRALIALIAAALPSLALAHQTMVMVQAYAFDTTPGMANGAAYLVIENTGPSEAKLIGVSTEVAEFAQVHTHEQDGDLRRMVALELPIVLQPGETLTMQPGGVHLMLLGLNEPLVIGDQIDLTLHLEGRHVRDLEVSVEVFGIDARDELVGKSGMDDMNMTDEGMEHTHSDHSNHGS